MNNMPAMLMCAAMWGMMNIPPEVMEEYAKKQKVKPKFRFCSSGKPQSEKVKARRRLVSIEEISDGKL